MESSRHGSKLALGHAIQGLLVGSERWQLPEQDEFLLELRLLGAEHVGESEVVRGHVALVFAGLEEVVLDDALHLVGVVGEGLGLSNRSCFLEYSGEEGIMSTSIPHRLDSC